MVAADYAWTIGKNVVAMLFWNPRTDCGPGCPANLLLIDGSAPRRTCSASSPSRRLGLTVTVVALIVRHWQTAQG